MSQGQAATERSGRGAAKRMNERASFYVWTAVVLAVALTVVVPGWHAKGGTTNPAEVGAGHHRSRTTVVLDSAILMVREGRETILVLAAVMASFLGANRVYRRPVAIGGTAAIGAGIATWFAVIWLIGQFHGGEYDVQAATGLPSLIVLLIVMNWFFHKVYWTGWISNHHKRRRSLLSTDADANKRRMLMGLAVLGFTSVYRECFEVVIFLQLLREVYGAGVVLEGVVIGSLFTAAAGVLTFGLHQRLPYKRLLVITGVMLLFVLLVSVGEEVNEMQLAGWIATSEIHGLTIPGWMGTWFSLFNNWQTFIGQAIALWIVIGSYVAAQYLRSRRPRRRGQQPAVPHAARVRGPHADRGNTPAGLAKAPPERPADIAVRGSVSDLLA